MTSSPPSDAEFNRKLALGILSMLHQKGLLTSDEVDAILYTARRQAEQAQAAIPAAPPPPTRSPLSDPPRFRGPLSDPPHSSLILRSAGSEEVAAVPPPAELPDTDLPSTEQVNVEPPEVSSVPSLQQETVQPESVQSESVQSESVQSESVPTILPLDDDARTAEARWVRKEPLAPPTFDIEL